MVRSRPRRSRADRAVAVRETVPAAGTGPGQATARVDPVARAAALGAILRALPCASSSVVLLTSSSSCRTPGFTALTESEGTVRVSIPAFEDTALPGALDVPVRHALVEALAGRRVRLASIEPSGDLVSFDSFRLAAAGTRNLVVLEGTRTLRSRFLYRHLLESHRRAGFTPRTWARLLGSSFQGETKKVRLELSPLRHDPVSGRTVLARRLTVRVEFTGQEIGERSLGGSRGRRPPPPSLRRSGVLVQLVAGKLGLPASASRICCFGPARPCRPYPPPLPPRSTRSLPPGARAVSLCPGFQPLLRERRQRPRSPGEGPSSSYLAARPRSSWTRSSQLRPDRAPSSSSTP